MRPRTVTHTSSKVLTMGLMEAGFLSPQLAMSTARSGPLPGNRARFRPSPRTPPVSRPGVVVGNRRSKKTFTNDEKA